MLTGTPDDMHVSRFRIINQETNERYATFESIPHNAGKRLVLYQKTFNFLYPEGNFGRVRLPRCIVAQIRSAYPSATYTDENDQDLNQTQ
jgi:hypothetical protein